MLVGAKGLAQEPSGAAAHHGAANPAGGNDAQARGGSRRQALPIGDQATSHEPIPSLTHTREVPPLLDVRRAGKPQA
jgi:hypothetical protein